MMFRFSKVALIVAVAATSAMASAQYDPYANYDYRPAPVVPPPSNHPASQDYYKTNYTNNNSNATYDEYGRQHVTNNNNSVANSASDPNRNYRVKGSTQKVNEWVLKNGVWVHKHGETWTGASGQQHGDVTESATTWNGAGTVTTNNNKAYYYNPGGAATTNNRAQYYPTTPASTTTNNRSSYSSFGQ